MHFTAPQIELWLIVGLKLAIEDRKMQGLGGFGLGLDCCFHMPAGKMDHAGP